MPTWSRPVQLRDVLLLCCVLLAGACGDDSSERAKPLSASSPGTPQAVQMQAGRVQKAQVAFPGFYSRPIVKPDRCDPGQEGPVGVPNPWKSTVDLSVYLKAPDEKARMEVFQVVGAAPAVDRAFYEDSAHAFRLFQSLFGCSADKAGLLPESVRLDLDPDTTLAETQALVHQLQTLQAVDEVVTEAYLPS